MIQLNTLIGLKRQARRDGWRKDWTAADEDALLKGCFFDEAASMAPIAWIESFCYLAEGEWDSKLIVLTDWQKEDLFIPAFGWFGPNGYRRYREIYLCMAKKNGKSTICAALSLYGLMGDGEPGAKIFLAATSKRQTKNVFDPVAQMVQKSSWIKRKCVVSDHFKTIRYGGNSYIQALSKDADSSEGVNGHFVIVDEVHVHRSRKLIDSLKYSGRARRQPMFIGITTRGDDKDSVCGVMDEHAMKVAAGEAFDMKLLPLIYAPDENAPVEAPATWYAGNPSLGVTITEESFRQDLNEAKLKGGIDWAQFRRYRLNLWTEAGNAEYDVEAWKNLPQLDEADIAGRPCFVGMDLSAKEDLTAVVCVWTNDEKTKFFVRSFQWTPTDKIEAEIAEGRKNYHEWSESGELLTIPGPIIRQVVIKEKIIEIAEQYGIEGLVFDRWRADDLIAEISEEPGIEVIEFSNTFGAFDYAVTELSVLIRDGAIAHEHNRCFDWQLGNVTCDISLKDGKKRPVKNRKKQGKVIKYKIDGPVAMLMALDAAIRAESSGSVYNTQSADPLAVED